MAVLIVASIVGRVGCGRWVQYTQTPLGAVFIRSRFGRLDSIPAGVVMNADNRAFVDSIRSPMRSRLEELEGLADRIRSRVDSRVSSLRVAS